MKRSKFSEAQVAFVLKQAEDGTAIGRSQPRQGHASRHVLAEKL